MAKLILSLDGLALKEIALTQARLTIGRKPHNDLQIDNLAISGEHAVITTAPGEAWIEDLNSTNGTLLNGIPVTRQVLHHNDVITLGKYRLKYQADAATPAGDTLAGRLPPLPPAAVQLLNGPHAGKKLDLLKAMTTLGKPGTQVAVIARRPHGYFVTHVEGDSFPLLNGKLIDAQAHPLADHDVLEIAGVKMEFFFKA